MNANALNNVVLLEKLDAITQGYRAAQILFTAVRFNLFQIIGGLKMDFNEIAVKAHADPRGIRILCDALVALGFLEKQDSQYINIADASTFLMSEGKSSQNALLMHNAALYESWSQLFDIVKTGKPALHERVNPELRASEKSFAQAMASSAKTAAHETADNLDLSQVRTLLDVGGGPGIYAIEFARRFPQLQAVILDGAETLEIAQNNISKAQMQHRITTKNGNAVVDDWGTGYDCIFISNIIHMFSVEYNNIIINKAAKALSPNGLICIKDFFLNEDRTSPEKSCLFAVNMLVNTGEGDCYTVQETIEWLEAAGILYEKVIDLRSPSRMVLGKKK